MNDRQARIDAARNRARSLKRQKIEFVAAPYLYPTPPDVARYVVELADIGARMSVLEPSAGTGALIQELKLYGRLTVVEIVRELADRIQNQFPVANVYCNDFLLESRATLGTFDRIIMNPPFDHGLDIRHILHAIDLLNPDGRLVAICADGQRQRAEFAPIADLYEQLPPNTFAAAGTRVNTAIVVIEAKS